MTDETNWAAIDANGLGDQLPAMVADLASSDRTVRLRAMCDLYAAVFHQETLNEGSAAIAPHLVGRTIEPTAEDAHLIALLLGDLTVGLDDRDRDDHAFVAQVASAVLPHLDAVAEWLTAADPRRVAASAYLLSSLGDHAEPWLDRLMRAAEEEADVAVRATVLVALGYLREERARACVVGQLSSDDPILRGAAAVSMLRLTGTLDPTLGRALATLATMPRETREVLQGSGRSSFLPFGGGSYAAIVTSVLYALEDEDPDAAVSIATVALTRRLARGERRPTPRPTPTPDELDAILSRQRTMSPAELEAADERERLSEPLVAEPEEDGVATLSELLREVEARDPSVRERARATVDATRPRDRA